MDAYTRRVFEFGRRSRLFARQYDDWRACGEPGTFEEFLRSYKNEVTFEFLYGETFYVSAFYYPEIKLFIGFGLGAEGEMFGPLEPDDKPNYTFTRWKTKAAYRMLKLSGIKPCQFMVERGMSHKRAKERLSYCLRSWRGRDFVLTDEMLSAPQAIETAERERKFMEEAGVEFTRLIERARDGQA